MDGTLYDEFDFIKQVYQAISNELGESARTFMEMRWLQKGSSYTHIFEETYDIFFEHIGKTRTEFIKNCLKTYRGFQATLSLTPRCESILNYCYTNYRIFLVTDGNAALQKSKFISLGLSRFFHPERVVFTDDHGDQFIKPSPDSLNLLEDIDPEKSVFLGDREADELFAKASGMQFQKVYNMIGV